MAVNRTEIEKRRGDELVAAKEELDRFFTLSPDMFCIAGFDGYFKRMNPAWEGLLGYNMEELLAEPFLHFVHPDDHEKTLAEIKKLVGGDKTISFENRYRCKDGSFKWLLWNAAQATGQQLIYAAARDITERKLSEEATRASEERFRTLVDHSTDGIFIANSEGRYLDVNSAGCVMLGYSREEMIQMTVADVIVPEEIERITSEIGRLIGGAAIRSEWRFRRKDGSMFQGEVIARQLPDSRVLATLRDITERKRAEVQLATLAHSIESTAELICITDLQSRVIFTNRAFEQTHGYTKEEILGKTTEILYSPHNPPSLYAEVLEQTRLGGWQGEVFDRRKDGTEFPVHLSTSLIKDKTGQVIGLVGVAQDITEREQAEEELRWKTAFLEAQVNSSIDGILVVDQHGKKILQNQRFVDLFKIPQPIADEKGDENRLRWVTDLTKNPEQFVKKVLYLYAHPDEISHDEIELKDGTILDRYSSPVIGKDGEYYGRIWTFRDITERKRAEEALQRQQAELRVLFDLIPALIWFKDTENRILRVNKQAAETAGKSVAEIEGKSTREIYPQDAAKFYADDLEVIRSGAPKLGIIETLRDQKGKELWIQTDKVPYCDKDGKVIGIVVLAQDITERKEAEAKLATLAHGLESTTELICITDLQDRFTFVNRAFLQAYGYTEQEILGETPDILFSPKNSLSLMVEVLEQSHVSGWHGEVLDRRKDGTEFPVSLSTSQVKDRSGNVIGLLGIARDITERKRLEKEILEISDREQSRIGQDLHDSLCQDLASIAYAAGLLEEKLREKLTPEAAHVAEIGELINRAIVQARDLARVLYPVKLQAEGLASALHDLAANVTKRTAIACTVNCPELLAMVDTAVSIHLFRIAQEAVANAVKHARPRNIWIQLDVKADTVALTVRDDGCGIAVPLAPSTGMGLNIMRYRARMIGGTLEVSRGSQGGTIIACSFQQKT
jgi:PAS domain S-box-containing protein